MHTILKSLVAAAAFCAMSAHAGVILQNNNYATYQINAFEPMAQSFTAQDPHIQFAFYYEPMNTGYPVDTVRLRLLDGEGLNGDTLANVDLALPAGFNGFYDVDFSAVLLTVGQKYTVDLSIPGSSPYWGASTSGYGNGFYDGGRAYISGQLADPNEDMTFRVTPVAQVVPVDVPEPGSIALLSLGLAGMGLYRRSKKN